MTTNANYPHRALWLRAWLCALTLSVATLAGEELFWRSLGHPPRVYRTKELWAYHRGRVNDTPQTIVLLGNSRVNTSICMRTFRDACPGYQIVQLAIPGRGSPIGTLQAFANDESFSGIIICGLSASLLAPGRWSSQSEYYLYQPAALRQFNTITYSMLRNYVAALDPRLSITSLMKEWFESQTFPKPVSRWSTFDREIKYDFSRVASVPRLSERRAQQLREYSEQTNFEEVAALIRSPDGINAMCERISGRGGHVVFIRLPSSAEHAPIENAFRPRQKFWDVFARSSHADCIHYEDVPGLAEFECPDGLHLDAQDAPVFTSVLAHELHRRGVVVVSDGESPRPLRPPIAAATGSH